MKTPLLRPQRNDLSTYQTHSHMRFYEDPLWLASKRLSTGRFRYWPTGAGAVSRELLAHEFSALIWGGDPQRAQAAPMWRRVALEPPGARAC